MPCNTFPPCFYATILILSQVGQSVTFILGYNQKKMLANLKLYCRFYGECTVIPKTHTYFIRFVFYFDHNLFTFFHILQLHIQPNIYISHNFAYWHIQNRLLASINRLLALSIAFEHITPLNTHTYLHHKY